MTDAVRRFADSALPLLLSHVWSSTIFLGLVLLVIVLARKRLTAGARFSLAFIGMLKFAIPVAIVEPFVRRLAAEIFGADSRGRFDFPLQVFGGAFRFNAASTALSFWPAIGITVWLAVAVLLIVRHALTRRRLVALSVRTAVAPHPREVEALSRARRRVRVRRGIDIARTALPEAPAVLRILRPLVVLPAAGCDDLTDEELESLHCHECAHVARHDNLVARIESVICALFWFHPLLWLAQRVTVIERERACDEVVAESADGRKTYLAALAKFCHAAIAPRLPGVSCMATANLKERMDHVMNYPVLRTQAPSAPRVTALASAALVLFTLTAALVGSDPALAGGTRAGTEPYAIKLTAVRSGDSITLQGTVSDVKTQQVLSAPRLTLQAADGGSGHKATAKSSGPGWEVLFEARPEAADRILVDVTIRKEGDVVQRSAVRVTATESATAGAPAKYTGNPITIDLKDADLRDVLGTFGKLAGLEMEVEESVSGRVTVSWHNVPWDQALAELLEENGLVHRLEGSTLHVSKK